MSLIVNSVFNTGIDAMTALMVRVSLHTGDPGTTGVNEVSGGTYDRQTVTWGGATGATATTTSQPQFDVPAGNTITHVGFWRNDNTTFSAHALLTNPETFTNDGQLTVDSATYSLTNS